MAVAVAGAVGMDVLGSSMAIAIEGRGARISDRGASGYAAAPASSIEPVAQAALGAVVRGAKEARAVAGEVASLTRRPVEGAGRSARLPSPHRAEAADTMRAMDAILEGNRFRTDRPLYAGSGTHGAISYGEYLGDAFLRRLEGLDLSGHWIDMGAGHGRAIAEFYRRHHAREVGAAAELEAPRTTAVARVPANTERLAAVYPEFSALYGRMLEDIPLREIRKADVISDVWGPLTYSPRMDHLVARYAKLLKPGGELFATIPLAHTLGRRSGQTIGVAFLLKDWLADARGVSLVSAEIGAESTVRLHLRRTREPLHVPELTVVEIRPRTPPRRIYEHATTAIQ